jgi:hypothetical protein
MSPCGSLQPGHCSDGALRRCFHSLAYEHDHSIASNCCATEELTELLDSAKTPCVSARLTMHPCMYLGRTTETLAETTETLATTSTATLKAAVTRSSCIVTRHDAECNTCWFEQQPESNLTPPQCPCPFHGSLLKQL